MKSNKDEWAKYIDKYEKQREEYENNNLWKMWAIVDARVAYYNLFSLHVVFTHISIYLIQN